jgi:hypothetical protein
MPGLVTGYATRRMANQTKPNTSSRAAASNDYVAIG